MSVPTISEVYFERWCREHQIEFRRIREARVQGHKRPDYAIKIRGQWCIVEIKQIDSTPNDDVLLRELLCGEVKGRWFEPGARLTRPMRSASDQLRKFSMRGFPTVVCFFDNTAGFYGENIHVIYAMAGKETLRFEVSSDPEHQPRFLGVSFGKKAALTKVHNTSVSAIAVLRQTLESNLIIDLYHNRYARVPISRDRAAPLVRTQIEMGTESPASESPSIFDFRNDPDWLAVLEAKTADELKAKLAAKTAEEVERTLSELRKGTNPSDP
jgi:hypothetical protein